MIHWDELSVFLVLSVSVVVLGFVAARWRRGDLNLLEEWGLAGRRFGSVITWFLLGGDLYTAYTFVAVPALVFGSGAIGLFAVPYTIIVYPIVFIVMPRMWQVARNRGYLTASDFVKDRFNSRLLALLIAITGIVATMPYIALQIYGIQVVISEMGINVEAALVIAFLALAAFTYVSGLRAPALIAVVKDVLIWATVLVAVIYIPIHLGGFGAIFAKVPAKLQNLPPNLNLAYATLAFGSALALFLYPHAITGTLAAKDQHVVRRNAAYLPAYSFMLGLIALLGYMAIAVGVHKDPHYGANIAVPSLFVSIFPGWFAGFAFAAIAIGALVPASVMSIAAGNLFTRNIYREYFRKSLSPREESTASKIVSLLVKVGALVFILLAPAAQVINFQLAGGVWIIQTLPAVFLGLYFGLDRWALCIGWLAGMITGTASLIAVGFNASLYSYTLFGHHTDKIYIGLAAFGVNLVVSLVLSAVFYLAGSRNHGTLTARDFGVEPAGTPQVMQPAATPPLSVSPQ